MSPVVPNFAYVTGNPDHLVGGQPAVMTDIQGPFYDLRAYVNGQLVNTLNTLSPPANALISASVGDVGMLNQVRAGRQLALADFTMLGLPAPLGLWNLGDLSDVSGNGRSLSNKGGVGFASGINGVAGTSAQFSGSTAQALYIADTGAADPFRIKTGSWGCWFRTAKRGTTQYLMSKHGTASNFSWGLAIGASAGALFSFCSSDGTASSGPTGVSDVTDDRWHCGVVTHDGTIIRLYVDGVQEATASGSVMFASPGPLNIGGYGADGGTPVPIPGSHFGRVDEAFVTDTVLTDDQVRALYLAKIPHGYATTPTRLVVNVRRRRRGAAFATGDFPAQPVRLYNFTGVGNTGNDEGSNGVTLTTAGAGTLYAVAGADGSKDGSLSISGGFNLQGTDAGLPNLLLARSYGCWFKTADATATAKMLISWGTLAAAHNALYINTANLACDSGGDTIAGPFVSDGQWHFAAVAEDSAGGGGILRRLYLDGRLVGSSTVMNSLTLAGANRFRIGANPTGGSPFNGQIDGAFVTAGALTFEQIAALYAKGTQSLPPSPKNEGDHVEFCDSTAVYATFDTLQSCDAVDVSVSA